jgi:hypothetical protein
MAQHLVGIDFSITMDCKAVQIQFGDAAMLALQ